MSLFYNEFSIMSFNVFNVIKLKLKFFAKFLVFLAIGLTAILNINCINGLPAAKNLRPIFDEIQVAETNAQISKVHGGDLQAAAGHHGGHHGYFQYARVPHKGAWEFGEYTVCKTLSSTNNRFIYRPGYRRGNPHHFREQHEQGKGPHFRTKLRWGDKKDGYGEHYWVSFSYFIIIIIII